MNANDIPSPASAAEAALPATMIPWRQSRYGAPDVMAAETVPVPTPGRDEVLVRFTAASINSGDVHIMRGDPRLVRLFFGLRRPRVRGRGIDLVGTIVARGDGVDGFAPGQRVVAGWRDTLAEYVAVPASRLSLLPDAVDPVTAAALPVAGNTAVTVLDACEVAAGSRVLVVGAGGGVGTLTVQLAADRGAEVWATCGARAEEVLRGLGAARTFDYRAVAVADLPGDHFDAVVDIAGETPLAVLRERLRAGGAVGLVGGEGGRVLGPIPRILRSMFARRGGRRFRPVTASTKADVTAGLLDLAAAGRLTPVIAATFPLTRAGEALAAVDAGRTVGKVVVTRD
ncbi:NAD(P)-dependent alcohol dehydrogenase [Microbacterium sp. Marseille-Q6648]|uniref:NAD(P)-dependent alcohol dehydrogenase n=1 Tax=Microbacterium sp. Marseille-Q6648 TaxID=2937991 RepID=UPI00203B525B|nr:NAD(P)-dependent alcohol dehydrogenase [Microbacterium sp. Marseille-Q6648]